MSEETVRSRSPQTNGWHQTRRRVRPVACDPGSAQYRCGHTPPIVSLLGKRGEGGLAQRPVVFLHLWTGAAQLVHVVSRDVSAAKGHPVAGAISPPATFPARSTMHRDGMADAACSCLLPAAPRSC